MVSNGLHENSAFGIQATPMAFDVAAIQYLYGANTHFQTGNNIYRLPRSNTLGSSYSCIWDAGGIDTIAAAGTVPQGLRNRAVEKQERSVDVPLSGV